jgi:hypothetical protein
MWMDLIHGTYFHGLSIVSSLKWVRRVREIVCSFQIRQISDITFCSVMFSISLFDLWIHLTSLSDNAGYILACMGSWFGYEASLFSLLFCIPQRACACMMGQYNLRMKSCSEKDVQHSCVTAASVVYGCHYFLWILW